MNTRDRPCQSLSFGRSFHIRSMGMKVLVTSLSFSPYARYGHSFTPLSRFLHSYVENEGT